MDLLNVLTLYMALVYSSSMQAAPADIQYSPEPTQIVVSTVEPAPTITATPTITPYYTPGPSPVPKPDFTSNPNYKQIKFKDKGDDVKNLQVALQKYGYYNGEIDGAYGYQTLEAVRIFQKLHSLSADGIAGRETLTVLYESDNILKLEPQFTPAPAIEYESTFNTIVPIFLEENTLPTIQDELNDIELPFMLELNGENFNFDYLKNYSIMLEDGSPVASSDEKPLLIANNSNDNIWILLTTVLDVVDESFSETFSFVFDVNVYNESEDTSIPNIFEFSIDNNNQTILTNILSVGSNYYININDLESLFGINATINDDNNICILSLENN
ncbi:MAG: peptidoglycan-binding protein [Christensenellaceae bacterium]|nr:peptidoglycan-binding protein [Christensenellaceae bacterium]